MVSYIVEHTRWLLRILYYCIPNIVWFYFCTANYFHLKVFWKINGDLYKTIHTASDHVSASRWQLYKKKKNMNLHPIFLTVYFRLWKCLLLKYISVVAWNRNAKHHVLYFWVEILFDFRGGCVGCWKVLDTDLFSPRLSKNSHIGDHYLPGVLLNVLNLIPCYIKLRVINKIPISKIKSVFSRFNSVLSYIECFFLLG